MNEATLTRQVNDYLKGFPKGEMWFYKASDRFTSGVPDFIGNYRGYFFALELKATGKVPKPLQDYTIKSINRIKYSAIYADNLDAVKSFFRLLKSRAHCGSECECGPKNQNHAEL